MVSWSETTEQRGLEAPPLTFLGCVIPETGDRKADLRLGSIWEDVKLAARIAAAIAVAASAFQLVSALRRIANAAIKGAAFAQPAKEEVIPRRKDPLASCLRQPPTGCKQ